MGDLGKQQAHPLPLYVCVHVAEFPTQARLRLRPEQNRFPTAVLDGNPPLEQVCSTNQAAKYIGVTKGMTRAQLEALAGIRQLERSVAEELVARNALLSIASTFGPRIEIVSEPQAGSSSFVFVLDMTGTSRIFGRPEQAVQSIAQSVRLTGLFPRLSASQNFHVAVCASTFAYKKPWIVKAGKEREALGKLPVIALGTTDEQCKMFELWGLRSVGELADLPEADLVSRLGQEGKILLQLARGEHNHVMVPIEPAFTLEEHVAFDTPEENLDSLLFVISPMLEQLIGRAQAYALAVASVTVTLTLDGGGEHRRTIKPSLPLTERNALLKLIQLDLQTHAPNTGVTSVHLNAAPGERSKVQIDMFSPQLPEPMRLDETLARIAALVGEDRVGSVRLLDTHRPDSFVMQRFTVPTRKSGERAVSAALALRRFRPPVPLHMWTSANKPEVFYFESCRYTATETYGPWRCSGDWWAEDVWSYEEWDVRAISPTAEPLFCLLSRNLLQKTWQLEALYD